MTDDKTLFEFLVLESAQALSLIHIWKKGNNGVAADCQHLLESHWGERKVSDCGTESGKKEING